MASICSKVSSSIGFSVLTKNATASSAPKWRYDPPQMGMLAGSYPNFALKSRMSSGFNSRETKTKSTVPFASSAAPRLPAYGGEMERSTPGWNFRKRSIHFCASTASTSDAAPLNVPVSFSPRGAYEGSAGSSGGCSTSGGGSLRPDRRPSSASSGVWGRWAGVAGTTHSTIGRPSGCAAMPCGAAASAAAIASARRIDQMSILRVNLAVRSMPMPYVPVCTEFQ